MPDIEQAYLSLIAASRGCTSVQRVVAELIPRYASHCPTALEAAAKVSINMYGWSLGVIMRGEDVDGVAYQTAKACIFGLVDICCTASQEAPTSSVIEVICAAVFINVLTFFTSSFEGQDIYHIGSQEILKLQEPLEFFNLKQENSDDNAPILQKLLKFRALCLLRIFFSFPKDLLAVCFELLASRADTDLYKRGVYFLSQVTSHLNADDVSKSLNEIRDAEGTAEVKLVSNADKVPDKSPSLLDNCFMGKVVNKAPSLRNWILSKYKKVRESCGSQDMPEISSILEKVFGSVTEIPDDTDCGDHGEDKNDSSKYSSPALLAPKIPIHHNNVSVSDRASEVDDVSASGALCEDNAGTEHASQNVKPYLVASQCIDVQFLDESVPREIEMSVSNKNMDTRIHTDSYPDENSTPIELKNQFLSPTIRKQQNYVSKNEYHGTKAEKSRGSSADYGLPEVMSASEYAPNNLPSPKQHSFSQECGSSNQFFWYCDGDPASMEVFPASNQLWIGSLGFGASDTSVRLQFEDFGPLDRFHIFPDKDFALIEYRNVLDAVKAREYMQASSLWGGCLRIKFLDKGLGSRGAVEGVAVGDSCHAYIGKVLNQWSKDEILSELTRSFRNPRVITDLTSENALLLEFWSAEEATTAMARIRHYRKQLRSHTYPNKSPILTAHKEDKLISGCELLVRQIDASVSDEEVINVFSRYGEICGWNFNRQSGSCFLKYRSYEAAGLAKSNLHGAMFGPKSIHVEVMTNNHGMFGNNMIPSPRAKVVPNNSFQTRLSHLDSCQTDFESTPGNTYGSSYMNQPKNNIHDHISPRPKVEINDRHPFHSSWTSSSETPHIWPRKANDLDGSMPMDFSYTERPVASHVAVQFRQPPPPTAASSFIYPIHVNPSGSWDNATLNSSWPMNQNLIPNPNSHVNSFAPAPFIPSSVTPLSHLPGSSLQPFNQMATGSGLSSVATPPPRSDLPLQFPSHPPLPLSHPPSVPPPPVSPPPSLQPFNLTVAEQCSHYKWQGNLSKSGVHYCSVYATREDSATCNYSNAISEPIEWPAQLDVTKRTDFQHVRTTFASTPPRKREVCRLLPSTANDQKGVHDFMSYLKQRECAGVIKIPAGKSLWARLLFILPPTPEICSLFAIPQHPAEYLLALVLPKETNVELP